MDVTVPPIVRGEFIYRDTLFVDVGGDGKRHPRAPDTELKLLLNGKAPKDQVGHWYEAQLIHYGLQRSKEKNTAKVRLQQALSQGKLKVPPHIADMEMQMKKEYAAAVRKVKNQAKAGAADDPNVGASKGKKRKVEEESAESSKKTKITMNVGNISINIEHGAQTTTKKKSASAIATTSAAAVKKTAAPKSSGRTGEATPIGKAAKTVASKPAKAASKYANDASESSTPQKSPLKQALIPKKASTTTEQSVKHEAKIKAEPKVKKEAKIKAEPKIKPENKIKTEPASKAKKAKGVKSEPNIKSEDAGDPMNIDPSDHRPAMVSGVYNITCDQLAEQLPDQASQFRLFLCVDNDTETIWGGFELGMKSGVIRTDRVVVDEPVSFGWRAKDSWDGTLRFGRTCFGEMELYGDQMVKGRFENLFNEPMVFEGQRRPGPLWCGRGAWSFREEWDAYVKEAYGR